MSRNSPTQTAPRKSRSNFQQDQPQPKKVKLAAREMDTSVHRLSKVPERYKSNKAVENEKKEDYTKSYFKQHPEALDKRPPDEKLEELEGKLAEEGLEPQARFDLLCQQKAIRSIIYGDNSPEMAKSLIAIGSFYNEQGRPNSARRHLEKARTLEKDTENVPLDESDHARLALEYADCMYDESNPKSVKTAQETISPFADHDFETPRLNYRRDNVQGRIYYFQEDYQQAVERFEPAIGYLEEAEGEETEELAQLLAHTAMVAHTAENTDLSVKCYQRAIDIFNKLGNTERAEMAEENLKVLQETEGGKENGEEEGAMERNIEEPKKEEEEAGFEDPPEQSAVEERGPAESAVINVAETLLGPVDDEPAQQPAEEEPKMEEEQPPPEEEEKKDEEQKDETDDFVSDSGA